mmetsp:Transcript_6798/g.9895  ORF Transcript_6798/g.9895 Transcript_6798/m.9895 type:complete len:268 (+) Transcript_6798:128-931(+)|eukprot:CAMPEP_0172425006 /NCGR_PEP_ID=MMETSP1064-20121228/29458_1 /TAXON_ID=202472 /ORGANISM="Aulacoseira subarctica , Strain CCAP 1002/5" /LENGTH=267 /DNA_ID=CAMNT_0013167539 /DNA_START=87 /DNA_END=890 /DNA_ORIENTATION=+
MTKSASFLKLNRYNTLLDDEYHGCHSSTLNKPVKGDAPLIFRGSGGSVGTISTRSISTKPASHPPPLDADPTITSSYAEEDLPTSEQMQHQTLLISDILREREQIKAENEVLAARLREAEEAIQKLSLGGNKQHFHISPSPALTPVSTFDDSTITTANSAKFGFLHRRTGTYDSSSESSRSNYPIHRTGTWESGYGVPVDASGVPSRIRYGHPMATSTALDGVVEEEKNPEKKKNKFFSLAGRKKNKISKEKPAQGSVSTPSSIFKM